MEAALSRLITESSLISVMLILALVWVTKQWLKEREARLDCKTECLEDQITRAEKYVQLVEQTKTTIEALTTVVQSIGKKGR
jgi:hypothetical protein